jgi:hypothetical protein
LNVNTYVTIDTSPIGLVNGIGTWVLALFLTESAHPQSIILTSIKSHTSSILFFPRRSRQQFTLPDFGAQGEHNTTRPRKHPAFSFGVVSIECPQ